ncbi:efflux RND transporter periplasmic adaptor subunit [Flavobacterium enshiense]|uniref:efflux RND transporter periplasmic adaptor subunit n=1 Tax=Flavobacterium enshiense TaxID=1341165 RepID=UPI00345D1ECF
MQNVLKKLFLVYSLGAVMISCNDKNEKTVAENSTASPEANKLVVDAIHVEPKELNHEEAVAGSVLPFQDVIITSELSQKITRISFKEGDYVGKGQLLYKLNDSEFRARLRELNAELKLARLNEQRLGKLLQSETVRQQDYDEALTKLHVLQAQEEMVRVQLSKTEIKAPFSGKIGISKVDLGSYVTPGLPLANIQNQSTVKIDFSIPEKYIQSVAIGKTIQFTTGLSDEKHTAVISASESGVDSESRNLNLRATASNSKGIFKGGQSAKIYFPTTNENTKGVLVPTEALIPSEKGFSVYVIKNGIAKVTPVTINNRTENEAAITSGLEAGDQVIISNILRLSDGTPVKAIFKNNI